MPWAPKTHRPVATTLKQHRPQPRETKARPSVAAGWLYGRKWRKARRFFLGRHPFCAEHKRNGNIVFANVVDHIIPHRGDKRLFWDAENWQSLCTRCHNAKTVTER